MTAGAIAIIFGKSRGPISRPARLMQRQSLRHPDAEDEVVYVFNGVRILVYAVLLAGTVYVGGAGALAALSARRAYNEVTVADFLLPWRWAGIPRKQADAQIKAGFHDLAEQNWGPGIANLRRGLRHRPENVAARVTLARLYVRMQRPVAAVDLLLEGFAATMPDVAYVQEFAATVETAQEFRKLVGAHRVYGAGAAAGALPPEARDFLFESALSASVRLRDLPLLRELWTNAPEDRRTARATERYVFGLLSLASVAEGQAELEQARLRHPHDQGLLNLAAVSARLMSGSGPEFLQAVEALQQRMATPEQTVFVVLELAQGGYFEQAAAVVRGLSGAQPETTAILGQVAARAKYLSAPAPLFTAVLAKAEEIRMDALPLLMPLCEAHLRYLNLAEAQQVLVAIQRLDSAVNDATQAWVRCMQAVVFACSQDNPAAALEALTSARIAGLNAEGYTWVIDAVLRSGSLTPANQLAEHAASVYPRSLELKRLLFIARQARAIKEADRSYLGAKPAPANSDSEFVFLATLELLATEEKHAEVVDRIVRLRAANPEWLARRRSAVDLLELKSRIWLDDDLAHFKALLEIYLRDDGERARTFFPLLRAWQKSEHQPPGLPVLDRALEKFAAYEL